MNKLRYLLILLALLSSTLYASELTTDEIRLKPQWQALDTNKDGLVSLKELPPFLAPAMGRSDFDHNGIISLQEYVAFDRDPSGSARLPLAANVRMIADLPYATTADPRQQLDIYLPKENKVEGPLPIIAYVHGGGWNTGSKIMARPQVMPLVDSGRYAAISIGYRLSWQDIWPAQIYDVKAAIRWIRAHADEYGLDAKRICAMGPSAGGHLVAELGTTNGLAEVEGTLGSHLDQSSNVECVIDFFGPTDLRAAKVAENESGPSPIAMLLGGEAKDKPALAAQASPLHHVDATAPPFFIVHGTEDPLVDYSQSVALYDALNKAGVPVILQTVNKGSHGDFGQAGPEVSQRVSAFLERTFYNPTTPVPHDTLDKTH